MTNEIMFKVIKEKVVKWIKQNINNLEEKEIRFEELANNDDCYRLAMDFENCIAELIVHQPDFAPYRFVSIQILSLIENNDQLIYCWYDKEEDGVEDIILHLNKGVNFALNY